MGFGVLVRVVLSILVTLFVFISFPPLVHADLAGFCEKVMGAVRTRSTKKRIVRPRRVVSDFTMTEQLRRLSQGLQTEEQYLDEMGQHGDWLDLGAKGALRFRQVSRKGPVNGDLLWLGGLNYDLERHLEVEPFFTAALQSGKRVTYLETLGQGASHVLHLHRQRVTRHRLHVRSNIEVAEEAVPSLAPVAEGEEIPTLLALSYWGNALAALAAKIHYQGPIVLLASGGKGFDRLILEPSTHNRLSMVRSFLNWVPTFNPEQMVANAIEEFFVSSFPRLKHDEVKLHALTDLSLGIQDLDATESIRAWGGKELVIVSAGKDDVVPGLLHYEMAKAGLASNKKVTFIFLEGVAHDVPEDLADRPEINGPLFELIQNRPEGWFSINQDGEVREQSEGEMRLSLLNQSREWWEKHRPHFARYPSWSMKTPYIIRRWE